MKKCVFHIPPPSLWRISTLATLIAISEYYKTRKCFWTLWVTRKQAKNIFFEKFKFFLWTQCQSLWRISVLVTCIAVREYYKTHKGFLDSGDHQITGCKEKNGKNTFFQIGKYRN